jgi:hypothetical protein
VSAHSAKLQTAHDLSTGTTNEKRREGFHALDRLVDRVDSVGKRLFAILSVGAQIGNFHHDGAERAMASCARVNRASDAEAPPTRIPGTRALRGAEGKQVHRGRITGGCSLAACCGNDAALSVSALEDMPSGAYQECRSPSNL